MYTVAIPKNWGFCDIVLLLEEEHESSRDFYFAFGNCRGLQAVYGREHEECEPSINIPTEQHYGSTFIAHAASSRFWQRYYSATNAANRYAHLYV